jgi:hypothetical protein
MNGFKAYRYYIALKLHFTNEKFNVFENRGNVKGSLATFQARNDSYLFEKLARQFDSDRDIIQFFVANFVYGNTNVVYDQGEAIQNYQKWTSHKESISRIFAEDLNILQLEAEKNNYTLDQLINCTFNDFPIIIKLYLGKAIEAETIVILNDLNPVIDQWCSSDTMGTILESELRLLKKLKGFVTYDKTKAEKIFKEFMTSFSVGV